MDVYIFVHTHTQVCLYVSEYLRIVRTYVRQPTPVFRYNSVASTNRASTKAQAKRQKQANNLWRVERALYKRALMLNFFFICFFL